MDPVFGSIRTEFAIFFNNIREAINTTPPPLDSLKRFLSDGYSYLQAQIACSTSIDDILDIVRDNCTLINISCLEGIVVWFHIKEAEAQIQAYKDVVWSVCKEIQVSLSLKERLNFPHLQSKTVVFILSWDPTGYTLQDVKDILAESVQKNVEVKRSENYLLIYIAKS